MNRAEKWHFEPLDEACDQHPDEVFDTHEVEAWERYEAAKRQLQRLPLTPSQYEARIRVIAAEMGI